MAPTEREAGDTVRDGDSDDAARVDESDDAVHDAESTAISDTDGESDAADAVSTATSEAAETTPDASGAGSAASPERDLPDETPPGPDGWPVVGNTLQFVRDPFAFYEEGLAPHGDVVAWSLAGFDMVSVLHPEEIERVLVTDWEDYGKTTFGDRGVDFAPDGLVFSEGEQWRNQRALLQDAFTVDRIRRYGERMVAVAEEHVERWPVREPIALNERFSDLTLDVLSRTLLGIDVDAGRGATVTRMAEALNERADVRRLSTFLPRWIPTPAQRRWERAEAAFDDLLDELIAEREAADGAADRDDLLSILLHAEGPDGYGHSERELRDQLRTFLFAGHDTTSLALTYTCLLLAQHDDVLEGLRAEWDEVLGDDPPAPADAFALEVTERVVSEALRLYPPAPVVFREARRDVELGGYRIPEGTKVVLPQFHVHADDRFYDDPEAFDPDRWTDEFEAELPDYAYFPFGGGPRHCIGMRFAKTELQLALPTLLRRYDLELLSDPDPEVVPGATMPPEEDVRVRLHPRN